MRRLFIVYGMKRTGNHAIINWIRAHEKFAFFNNIVPIGPIIEGKKTIPLSMDFTEWLHGATFRNNRMFIDRVKKLVFHKRSMIVSLEDHNLQFRPFHNIQYKVTNILLLRDPINMLSSRIRKGSIVHRPTIYPTEMNSILKRVPELWKSYAKEFLGLTNYLDNKVLIYFDSWFSDQNYRRKISRELGLAFNDSQFSNVAKKSSGGSSFDGTNFNGNSQAMNVLDRGSQLSLKELKLLDNLLQDEELNDLCHRIKIMYKN